MQVLKLIGKGIVGGSLVGFVVGGYAIEMTYDYACGSVDFEHPLAREIVQQRFRNAMLLTFVATFIVIGPFVAFARYGPWLRHAGLWHDSGNIDCCASGSCRSINGGSAAIQFIQRLRQHDH